MANFYYPQAFSANPIQSFIDGKIAAQDRAKKERDRQVDLFYKYQDFQLRKARHEMGKAKLEAETKLLERRAAAMKLNGGSDPFARGRGVSGRGISGGRGISQSGVDIGDRPAIFSPASRPGFSPAFDRERWEMREGVDPFRQRPIVTGDADAAEDGAFGAPDRRTAFYEKFGRPMGLGGPKPTEVEDGYPTPMSFDEAEDLYGDGFADDANYAKPKRQRRPQVQDPFAQMTREPDPFMPNRRRADPFVSYDDYEPNMEFLRPIRGY